MSHTIYTGGKVIVAVPHINVDVSTKEFLRNMEVIIESSRERGANLIILPVPLHPLVDVLRGVRKISSYEATVNELISKLLYLSNKLLQYIILSPIIRRAGSRRYLMSVLLTPQGEEIYVKKVVGNSNLQNIVSSGREINPLVINDVKVCTLVGSDIRFPEIPRLCNYLGSDLIVSIQLPFITDLSGETVRSIAISRALENSVPVISLGSYTRDKVNLIPTLVVSSSGDVIDECNNYESSLLIVEVSRRRAVSDETIVKYLKNIIRYMIS